MQSYLFLGVIFLLWKIFSFTVSMVLQLPFFFSVDFLSASFGLCLNWPSFLLNQISRNQFITIENYLTSFILTIKNPFFFNFWITQSQSKNVIIYLTSKRQHLWIKFEKHMTADLPDDKNDCSWKLCLPDNDFRFAVRTESCEKCSAQHPDKEINYLHHSEWREWKN